MTASPVVVHRADIRRRGDIARALDASMPDAIFHLAGISHGGDAAADPVAAIETNVGGTTALMAEIIERTRAGAIDPTILVTGSALQYGIHAQSEIPLDETTEQQPRGIYAGSKLAQEAIALGVHRSDGLRVIVTRSFNHSGAGQEPKFQLPRLVERARRLAAGNAKEMPVEKWPQVKDWLHVDDVVDAYIALVDRGVPGEAYNVSRGEGVENGRLAERLLQRMGSSLRAEADPAPFQPVDVPVLVGDSSKLRTATGWAPRYSLDDLLDDLLRAEAH